MWFGVLVHQSLTEHVKHFGIIFWQFSFDRDEHIQTTQKFNQNHWFAVFPIFQNGQRRKYFFSHDKNQNGKNGNQNESYAQNS